MLSSGAAGNMEGGSLEQPSEAAAQDLKGVKTEEVAGGVALNQPGVTLTAELHSQHPGLTGENPTNLTSCHLIAANGNYSQPSASGDTGVALHIPSVPTAPPRGRNTAAIDHVDLNALPELSQLITRRDVSRRELPMVCHVIGCGIPLGPQAEYYQRYRICKDHLRAPALRVDGVPQRFCQQCGRFHEMEAFDADKRNCRARLAQHNSRRRKAGSQNPGVLPYGQGQAPRRRTAVDYDRYDDQFEYEFDDLRRRQRARTAAAARDVGDARLASEEAHNPDVGFLDQLAAAATGLEAIESPDYESLDQIRASNARGGRNQQQQPPRLTSRPVQERADYGSCGPRSYEGDLAAAAAATAAATYGSHFNGWTGATGAYGGAPPPQQQQLTAILSEVEQLMGRQLLQQIMAQSGVQLPMSPPQPANPSLQLMEMFRAMGAASAAGYAPPPPLSMAPQIPLALQTYLQSMGVAIPPGLQQSMQQQYRPSTVLPPPPPSISAHFGGEGTGFSKFGSAETALDALRQLVGSMPGRGVSPPGAAPSGNGGSANTRLSDELQGAGAVSQLGGGGAFAPVAPAAAPVEDSKSGLFEQLAAWAQGQGVSANGQAPLQQQEQPMPRPGNAYGAPSSSSAMARLVNIIQTQAAASKNDSTVSQQIAMLLEQAGGAGNGAAQRDVQIKAEEMDRTAGN